MHLPDHILGKGTVEKLRERVKAPILVIGSDHFTRAHLAGIDCFNFLAAAQLSNIIATLKVENTRDLFNRIPPRALALPGLGVISLATLGAAFEHKLGKTLSNYIDYHLAENEAVRTFSTIKHNSADAKAERKVNREAKARKHGRNNQAARLRADRYISRHPKTRGIAPVVAN